MKVYSKVMVGSNVLKNPVDHDLGVVIEHDGKEYTIFEDNNDQLVLSGGTQLIIRPRASNSVIIESEE